MTEASLNRHRKQLQALLTRLRGEVDALRDEAISSASGMQVMSTEQADAASHEAEEGRVRGILDAEGNMLNEVQAALARIDLGTYGLCASCNEPITVQRLEAVPYARLCVDCAARQEKSGQ